MASEGVAPGIGDAGGLTGRGEAMSMGPGVVGDASAEGGSGRVLTVKVNPLPNLYNC